MDLTTSLVNMANQQASFNLANKVTTTMMAKAMDTQKDLAAGMLKQMEQLPSFPGEDGYAFSALA